jgi:hypothetical protein
MPFLSHVTYHIVNTSDLYIQLQIFKPLEAKFQRYRQSATLNTRADIENEVLLSQPLFFSLRPDLTIRESSHR